jgi:hypothetical protein
MHDDGSFFLHLFLHLLLIHKHGWGDLYQVLPPKADIEVVKLGGGSRTVLYFVEAQPLFFDPSGRDDWVPTGAHSPWLQLF